MLVLRTTSRTWTLSIRLNPITTLAFVLYFIPSYILLHLNMSLLRLCFAHPRLRTMNCVLVAHRKTQIRRYVDNGAPIPEFFFVTFLRMRVGKEKASLKKSSFSTIRLPRFKYLSGSWPIWMVTSIGTSRSGIAVTSVKIVPCRSILRLQQE